MKSNFLRYTHLYFLLPPALCFSLYVNTDIATVNMMSPARTPQYRDLGDPMAREAHNDPAGFQEALIGKAEGNDWDEEGSSDTRTERIWPSRSRRVYSRILEFRWIFDAALILIIIGLVLDRGYRKERYGEFEGAGDITGFAPKSK